MDFFLCFFMDIGRYLLRACGLIQTVTILTVQKKTWLQRSMVVQLPFLVAHDGWTTLSGFFHTLGMFLQSCCPNTFIRNYPKGNHFLKPVSLLI